MFRFDVNGWSVVVWKILSLFAFKILLGLVL